MKKFLLLVAAIGMSCSAFAQQEVLIGDLNRDGKITQEDVDILADNLLHNRETKFVINGKVIYSRDGESHEWVNLGLPSGTLWATYNVGASKPEEYGDHFAWGEVKPHADNRYYWSTYKWMTEGKSGADYINKYQIADGSSSACWYENGNFIGDGKDELESADDAATYNWGSEWQMPSKAQIDELLDSKNTKTEWTTLNGVYGLLITSVVPGYTDQFIFMPAAGIRHYAASDEGSSEYGYYWTRSIENRSNYAQNMRFTSDNVVSDVTLRYNGVSVRPVRVAPYSQVTGITLSRSVAILNIGETAILTTTIEPAAATDYSVTWSSSDESVATVNADGVVTAVAAGKAVITATANGGSGVSATCSVVVMLPNTDTKEYVDLGLPSGTLWATCNVGASSPEECGDYFAWGETASRSIYSWRTYFDAVNGSSENFNKYYNDGGMTELLPEDDAATANWGSKWQMPSHDQIVELCDDNSTESEWTTLNGVKGMLIKSKTHGFTGRSIFLPAAGYFDEEMLCSAGLEGYYWSRSLDKTMSWGAYSQRFDMNEFSWGSTNRFCGNLVRPVLVVKRTITATSMSLSKSKANMWIGNTLALAAVVRPFEATNKSVTWSSSDESVATVSADGTVTAVALGKAVITATLNDDSSISASCTIIVKETNYDTREYVNLGLPSGTLWATCNIGATSPEEYGDYFGWGETVPYYTKGHSQDNPCSSWRENKTGYNWKSYFDYISDSKYKKYDNNGGERVLLPEDDAATENWGEDWQMPSENQVKELKSSDNTISEWTTLNGVYGRLYTSKKNGNSIFLPAAGYRVDEALIDVGTIGLYWCNKIYWSDPDGAKTLDISPLSCTEFPDRCYGYTIRPVRAQNK